MNDCSVLISTSLPISNRMRKKQERKTSYERTNEAFEMAKEKRRRKKEVMPYTRIIIGHNQSCFKGRKLSPLLTFTCPFLFRYRSI